MRFYTPRTKGFTVIELSVAVAIIAVLASVAMFSYQDAKKKARDTQRLNDIKQLQLSLRMYRDANSSGYPASTVGGELVTSVAGVGQLLVPYLTSVVTDPMNGNAGYGYYYNSSYNCTQANQVVLVVKTMEGANAGNFATVCGGIYNDVAPGVTPTANSYIVVLK